MAGIFDKLAKSREEKKDKEAIAAVEEQIVSLIENLATMRQQTLAVMEEEKSLKKLVKDHRAQVARAEEEAKEALVRGDEAAAKAALSRKVSIEEGGKELVAMYEEVSASAQKMRDAHDALVVQIEGLKARLATAQARKDAVDAQEAINEMMSGSAEAREHMRELEEMARESEEQRLRAEAMAEAEQFASGDFFAGMS